LIFDLDPVLLRLEQRALAFCGLAALTALAIGGGNPDVALGVVGGGLLSAASYWAIRSSVTGLVALAAGRGGTPSRLSPRAILLRLSGRYALLGLLAYAMIARLRLHPVGLMIGLSSLVAAAALEAAGVMRGAGRRDSGPPGTMQPPSE
jgi:hypothetical protein